MAEHLSIQPTLLLTRFRLLILTTPIAQCDDLFEQVTVRRAHS